MPRARQTAAGESSADEQPKDGQSQAADENGKPDEIEQVEETEQVEILLPAGDAVGADERDRVPFAGLLAHKPELRDAELTRERWQEELEGYLTGGPLPEGREQYPEQYEEPTDDVTEECHAE